MRIHRFYIGSEIELKHDFWLQDSRLINQWRKVLRMQAGQEVVLFDGIRSDRLYKLDKLTDTEAHLLYVTDYKRKLPKREVYLLWSLLKKDKNDWVLQKGTELGVKHFVPLLADRSEKTGFDEERALKIAIEASEQCGRSDIPNVREPISVETAITELGPNVKLFVCEAGGEQITKFESDQPLGVLIGPEGGWSDSELALFETNNLSKLDLGQMILRAETAAVIAAGQLLA